MISVSKKKEKNVIIQVFFKEDLLFPTAKMIKLLYANIVIKQDTLSDSY